MSEFTVNTKIINIKQLGTDYILLDLVKPRDFNHAAGQYTKLFFPDNPDRPIYLSIASPPESEFVQLCIGTSEPQIHSMYIDAYENAVGLHLAKPEGKFVVPEDGILDYVFVAGGSGVSPLRSMLFDVLKEARSIIFILGGAQQATLPYFDEFAKLASERANFQFWPCVEVDDDGIFKGNVVDLFCTRLSEVPKNANFFLCGPKAMITAFTEAAIASGVVSDRIYFERY